MRFSLRNRYFGWLLLLILTVYGVIFASFCLIEFHEAHEEATPFVNEIDELVAMLFVMAATLPLSLAVTWSISGVILRPLNAVLETAEHISQGNLDRRIPPIREPEQLARIAASINDAFDRYSDTVRRLEEFSGNASHQLRTPLAAIRTLAEVNLQSDRSVEEYRETMGQILEESRKLQSSIDQLMALSRLDRSMRQSFACVDLAGVSREWTENSAAIFESRVIEWRQDGIAGPFIRGDSVLLHEVFNNLLNNAVAATGEHGRIRVMVRHGTDGRVVWTVEDSGPGIPAGEREKIFDRFFRGTGATYSGSGLGLCIVKQIVTLHGGEIRAETSPDLGGACIRMIFPAVRH